MTKKWFRTLAIMLLSISVAACGGGNSFSGSSNSDTGTTTTPGTGSTQPVAKLTLSVSSPELDSDGAVPVTLTARAQDVNSNYVTGAALTFAVISGGGGITVVNGTTNDTGTATALLDPAGDKSNRTIVVSVTDSSTGAVATASVLVVGTNITIAGATSIEVGQSAKLTATLKDSGGAGIPNQTVAIASSKGNTLSASSLTTNTSGQVTFTVTGTASGAGSDSISVTAMGITKTYALTVNATGTSSLTLNTSPTAGVTEVNIGAGQAVKACWTETGVAHPGKTIYFSTTRGTLSAGSATTDASGCATVTATGSIAGIATIKADADPVVSPGDLTTTLDLEYVATTPSTMTLQPSLAVIGVGEQSTITASIKDANANPVKNKRINFSITAYAGGNLSAGSAITDSNGQASTVFTAGTVASADNGVAILANVDGVAVSATTNLTVGNKALYIALGTGNTMSNFDSAQTMYKLPYSVIVTDSAGAPVANREVTLKVWSTHYAKGWMYPVYVGGVFSRWSNRGENDANGDGNFDGSLDGGTFFTCGSEDVNRNGTNDVMTVSESAWGVDLDGDGNKTSTFTKEDVNGDLSLTPGNKVTFQNGSSTFSVKTDATGTAVFSLVYAEQYANWLKVKLTALAPVAGTEYSTYTSFWLQGLASDFTSETTTPPGFNSPFGSGFIMNLQKIPANKADCTSTD